MSNFKERVIVALDFCDMHSTRNLLDELEGKAFFYKIGFELFTSCGARSVEMVKERGCSVFLDLKFHDIPNTVLKSVAAAGKLGADIINVHASGGMEMMAAAVKGAGDAADMTGKRPKIIAVTMLTSLSDEDVRHVFYPTPLINHKNAAGDILGSGLASGLALHLAGLAKDSGLDGVVCSGLESRGIKNAFGSDFITVTPGIRLKSGMTAETTGNARNRLPGDQKRTVTPSEAFHSGADYIVVGREVTASPKPSRVLLEIHSDIEKNFSGEL